MQTHAKSNQKELLVQFESGKTVPWHVIIQSESRAKSSGDGWCIEASSMQPPSFCISRQCNNLRLWKFWRTNVISSCSSALTNGTRSVHCAWVGAFTSPCPNGGVALSDHHQQAVQSLPRQPVSIWSHQNKPKAYMVKDYCHLHLQPFSHEVC